MENKKVLILGASSKVASEIAKLLANKKCTLFLIGRNEDKILDLKESIGSAYTGYAIVDFTNTDATEHAINDAWNTTQGFDTVLICHGTLGEQIPTEKNFRLAKLVIDTNFTCVVAQLITLSNLMLEQGFGNIGVITSVAGDRGRPRNFTYGAAKGALSLYVQGLRSTHWKSNVSFYDFKLGPVDTPMTTSHTKDFSFTSPEKAALLIVSALSGKRYTRYIPAFWTLVMFVVRRLPEPIFQRLSFLSGR